MHDRADISTPAFSTPAGPCQYFHSRIFHHYIFDRADFSTPAFSVAPIREDFQIGNWRSHSQYCMLQTKICWEILFLFFVIRVISLKPIRKVVSL